MAPRIEDAAPLAEPDVTLFRAAIGRHFASVCLISTCSAGEKSAVTATAVSSVSVDPPRLLICINRSGETHGAIRHAGIFCVNIMCDDQEELAGVFAASCRLTRAGRMADPEWRTLVTGAPAHSRAAAAIDCRVAETFEQGTHTIFIGEVMTSWEPRAGDPLLYGRRGFHRLSVPLA